MIGAERLLAEAAQLRATQPRKALQLGAAAVTLNPSPATRASLVETLAHSPYAGTIAVDRAGSGPRG